MELEILVAVLATGLGLIGGMLVIWRDYPRHRYPDQRSEPQSRQEKNDQGQSQEKLALDHQSYISRLPTKEEYEPLAQHAERV